MFPWLCLAQLPMFYANDWPRMSINRITKQLNVLRNCDINNQVCEEIDDVDNKKTMHGAKISNSIHRNTVNINLRKRLNTLIIIVYCTLQLFLPYSHFITKGFNNWTNGLYGYSWDMMVHSYETYGVQIRIVDNIDNKSHFIEPFAFTEYDRWTKYADMAKQYAQCIYKNLQYLQNQGIELPFQLRNISIYYDVWCSMNGRLIQRIFDPRIDILKASWSPFHLTSWSLPLLDEFKYMRPELLKISANVYNWNNASDVLIVADYPGLTLRNVLPTDIFNGSLTLLQGKIIYNELHSSCANGCKEVLLSVGEQQLIPENTLYTVKTIGANPSIYMITFTNATLLKLNNDSTLSSHQSQKHQKINLLLEFKERILNYKQFLKHIGNCLLNILYGIPIPITRLKNTYKTNA